MPASDFREQILRELTARMRQVEQSARSPDEAARLSSGIEPLDRLLGQARSNRSVSRGGLLPGTLVEWLSPGSGSGAQGLALKAAASACRLVPGTAVVVIDPRGEFYPPAAAGRLVPLERVLVLRPQRSADVLWALEQALRCPGVAATFCPIDRAGDKTFRRLQLAAEAGGGLGLLLRPARAAGDCCWADVRLLVQPLPGGHSTRKVRLEILHVRAGKSGGTVELEIDDETNHVSVAPALAAPAAVPRAARA